MLTFLSIVGLMLLVLILIVFFFCLLKDGDLISLIASWHVADCIGYLIMAIVAILSDD